MREKPLDTWHILLVEDDEDDYQLARSMLMEAQGRRIELDWAPTFQAGQEQLHSNNYHAVLIDYDLGPKTGIELIRETAAKGYRAPLILYTGRGSYEVYVEGMEAGATLYLTKKEATPLLIERSIQYAIEHKQIEAELDRRFQERSEILNSIQDGLIGIDRNWRISFINRRAAQNGGFEPEELSGRNLWEAFPRLQGTSIEKNYRLVMEEHKPVQFEMQGVYQEKWYSVSVYPSSGGITVFWQDITDHRQAVKALRESEERFRAMADGTPVLIWVTDAEGQIEFINQAYSEFFGVTTEQVRSEGWLPLVHPDDYTGYVDVFMDCLRQHKRFHAECRVRHAGGDWRWIDSYGQPRFSPSGDFLGMAGSSIDSTDRKRAGEALQAYTEQLKRSNQALEDFAFTASHDLREPLRKVRAFGDRLVKQAGNRLDQQEQDYLERMDQAAERMQRMLDGLLAYSRITTQERPLETCDLNQAAAEVITDLEVRMMETGGKVELDELPVIQADPMQMRQLLQNLIGNALKFHRPGVPPSVKVFCRSIPDDCIELVVEDNGIGFDMSSAGQLFKPFHRLVGKSEYEGSGMGLAICQKIAERHKGTITAESEPGVGSAFMVTLPRMPDL